MTDIASNSRPGFIKGVESRVCTMYPKLTKLTYFGPGHFPPIQYSETLHGPSFGSYKMGPEGKKSYFLWNIPLDSLKEGMETLMRRGTSLIYRFLKI